MQTIQFDQEASTDLRHLLEEEGWQSNEDLLQREGADLLLHVSYGSLVRGALPLGESAGRARKILRWLTDWEVQRAVPRDLPEMCTLKARQIEETFLFLSPKERAREIAEVAGEEHMHEEMNRSDFWICRKRGELWALGGLRENSPKDGTVYSGYSLGEGAGAALLALRIQEAQSRGYKKLWAYMYGYNEQSPRHLRYQGFRMSNGIRTSPHNPPHRIRYWQLLLP